MRKGNKVKTDNLIISGNTFNGSCHIDKNWIFGEFWFNENNAKDLSFINNKFVKKLYFTNNRIDKIGIASIKFINDVELSLQSDISNYYRTKEISHKDYFKNIKKTFVHWEEFQQSLCNLKSYFLSKHDYYTSKIFEELERKAHFESRIKGKNWLVIAWIAFTHFIEYFAKYIYMVLAFIATIATIFAALFTVLSYLNKLTKP